MVALLLLRSEIDGSTTRAFGTAISTTAQMATSPPKALPARRTVSPSGRAFHSSTNPVTALMAAMSTTDRGEVRIGMR